MTALRSLLRGGVLGAVFIGAGSGAAPASAAEDPPGELKMEVRCPTPGAVAFVEGERWGRVPQKRRTPKRSGTVRIVLLLEDHAVLRRSVAVKGENDTVAELPALDPQPWPRIDAGEGVAVGWESKEFGWFEGGKAPPGAGRAFLGRRGFVTQVGLSRTLAPEQTLKLEPGPWEPRLAVLDLWDFPRTGGAAVSVDGKQVKDGTPILPGPHVVRSAAGRKPVEAAVEVVPGQRVVRPPVVFSDPKPIDAALAWLVRHQSADGRWSSSRVECDCRPFCAVGVAGNDVGVSGLALLALLGGGSTPTSGPHAAVVSKGLDFLVKSQSKDGFFQPGGTRSAAFGQPIAELAVLEAWGVTGDPTLGAAAERGLDAILALQNPYLAWRYGVRDGDNDTAVSSWMTLAVTTAYRMDVGQAPFVDVRPELRGDVLNGPEAWLDKMTAPDTGNIGYQRRGIGRAYGEPDVIRGDFGIPTTVLRPRDWALTAMGLLAQRRIALSRGEDPDRLEIADLSLRGVELNAPFAGPEPDAYADVHAAWFGARLLRSVRSSLPHAWETGLQTLAGRQLANGGFPPDKAWSREGGAIYTTAMAALALQQALRR